ncbi:HDIG domain-containing protein [Candidatus Bathyarchaeota archaeon]|nr:HDIG domain-containing protein [Candidatus Bathyarchaeota archaeon]
MSEELLSIAEQISDKVLRGKVKEFLRDPPCDISASALPLSICPAGAYQHHSYRGGLVEHILCVIRLSLELTKIIEDKYGGEVNRDYVLAGALLHDIMKVYCYEDNPEGGFITSELGGMIDHLTLMVAELYKRDFPLEVIHIIASHHGDVSPTKPKTIEALIVSVADLADSELNNKLLRGAEYLLRKSGAKRPKLNSAYDAFRVVEAKRTEGWDGVHRVFEELLEPKN